MKKQERQTISLDYLKVPAMVTPENN